MAEMNLEKGGKFGKSWAKRAVYWSKEELCSSMVVGMTTVRRRGLTTSMRMALLD